jgi:hypothetical protein
MIAENLPAFYKTLHEQWERLKEKQGDTGLHAIVLKLKKAIMDGDITEAEKIIKDLGVISLDPTGRELYFILFDMLFEDDNEKAVGVISFWEKLYKAGLV